VYGRVNGVTVVGVHGHLVAVEAHVGRGLPSLTLTGLYLDDPWTASGLSADRLGRCCTSTSSSTP
jgi:hypothetical protein